MFTLFYNVTWIWLIYLDKHVFYLLNSYVNVIKHITNCYQSIYHTCLYFHFFLYHGYIVELYIVFTRYCYWSILLSLHILFTMSSVNTYWYWYALNVVDMKCALYIHRYMYKYVRLNNLVLTLNLFLGKIFAFKLLIIPHIYEKKLI